VICFVKNVLKHRPEHSPKRFIQKMRRHRQNRLKWHHMIICVHYIY